ncbi:hypothetical protein AVEN_217940-1 [Araneus ventricosus]|uniref:Mos1 transposase HTH domain-containing protein n=1 Tax=Araneus ventricosus TaxID=182803 RepID=A0A4Y2F5Q9_ARAVE|nr:hypothetical protein AVEN_104581-1 [Araneus ventricosus]GBM36595.1 hypothetical protein AVEN_217940-1 [Araneus ventricosus]
MFTEGDQRSSIKVKVARGKIASECYHGLHKLVRYGIGQLHDGSKRFVRRNENSDLHRTGRPSILQHQIEIVSGLLSIDRRWTVRKLSVEVCLSHQTVWHTLKKW